MRVLFVSNDPTAFAADSAVRIRLMAYARGLGELHVLTRGPVPAGTTITDGPLTLHSLGRSRIFSRLTAASRARRIIRAYGIEIVSAQDPFEYGFAALRASSGTRAKLHIQMHTDPFAPSFTHRSFSGLLRRQLARYVLPKADGIRVVSERIRRSLLVQFGARIVPPSVIPVAVPQETHESADIEKPHSFMFLTVGRLEPEKRIADIIDALAIVRKVHPEAGLWIAGDGRLRAPLARHARTRGVAEAVHMLGWQRNVPALMGVADTYVQASAYEGYGLTLVEAARAGCPIISTNVGVIGDMLRAGTEAQVCPVEDAACLAKAMQYAIEHASDMAAMAARARERAHAQVLPPSAAYEAVVADLAKLMRA